MIGLDRIRRLQIIISALSFFVAMLLALLFATLLVGCAVPFSGITKQVGPWGIRQCGEVFYVYQDELTDTRVEQVRASFDYWNRVVGKRVWIDGGSSEGIDPADGYVIVRFVDHIRSKAGDSADLRVAGRTTYAWKPDGCMAKTVIHIARDETEGYSAPWVETYIRHEIGHALGLDHNDDPDGLMWPEVAGYGLEPVGVTPDEREQVRDLYDGGVF